MQNSNCFLIIFNNEVIIENNSIIFVIFNGKCTIFSPIIFPFYVCISLIRYILYLLLINKPQIVQGVPANMNKQGLGYSCQ